MRRALLLLVILAGLLLAQPMDEDFAQSVKQWTTRPEFLSPLVDHLPLAPGIPTPRSVLGYHVGAPKKLTPAREIRRYFEALAKASPRLRLVEGGISDEGRPLWSALIASEETLRDIETYRGYLQRLADPRGLSDGEARAILSKAKPIYHFTGGLHSSETGPPEMLMELAYRLVAAPGAPYEAIRQNLIVMITPVLEPDGQERYTEWYYRHKIHEEGEDDRIPGPPFWGKYVYHDNNRDMHYSQIVMRAWLRQYLHWKPTVVHDLHESVPFLYTFSGQPPHNENLDPILYAELPWFANYEMTKLTSYGMPGAWTHGFVDMWSVGYLGFMASNHNGLLRMYETYGNGGANTMKRRVDNPEEDKPNGAAKREWFRPLPAYREVEWSLRNNTNYMQTAAISALELAAAHPGTLVENFYRKSRNALEEGSREAPYGFLIPANQREMTRVAWIVNTLRVQGIEVGRLQQEFKVGERVFPAGAFVVKRNQPYGRLAKSLLEKQNFPEGNLRTYDDTGWTMGLCAGAEVVEVADKALLAAPVELLSEDFSVRGEVKGSGPILAVIHNGANTLVTFRWRLGYLPMEAAESEFKAGEDVFPAGTLLMEDSDAARIAVESLGLRAMRLPSMPEVARHPVDLPRVAVYSTWGNTQPAGWVRHTLDYYKVPYQLIYKEQVLRGNLRSQFDLILVPSRSGDAKALVFDLEPANRPLAYKRTTTERALGLYGESEDITGGMGLAGVTEITRFVQEGGVLVTLGNASAFPAEFGITRRVDVQAPPPGFYAPGPIVQMEAKQPRHPVFYGYPSERIAVNYANGPMLSVPYSKKPEWVVAAFNGTVLSGLARGGSAMKNMPALLDIPVGQGRVLLFTTNPMYRWKNPGEFGMLFNVLLHYNDRVPARGTEESKNP
jgi:hypothetical protein